MAMLEKTKGATCLLDFAIHEVWHLFAAHAEVVLIYFYLFFYLLCNSLWANVNP